MTQDEIQTAILRVCKVAGHDGDFNVVGFYALCDRLKQLGAEEEREACAKIADEWAVGWPHPSKVIAERIRARGQA